MFLHLLATRTTRLNRAIEKTINAFLFLATRHEVRVHLRTFEDELYAPWSTLFTIKLNSMIQASFDYFRHFFSIFFHEVVPSQRRQDRTIFQFMSPTEMSLICAGNNDSDWSCEASFRLR